jgi:hypothetical protein
MLVPPLGGEGGVRNRVPYWERGTTSGGSVGGGWNEQGSVEEVETGCVEWSC